MAALVGWPHNAGGSRQRVARREPQRRIAALGRSWRASTRDGAVVLTFEDAWASKDVDDIELLEQATGLFRRFGWR